MNDVTLLVDANVLIDYQNSDMSVFQQVSKSIGRVVVLDDVLEEVDGMTDLDCKRWGIEVITADMESLLRAGERIAGLSFRDMLCLLTCKIHGYVCVTNDRVLQNKCKAHGVTTMFGLQLMIDLVEIGALGSDDATAIALKMQESSPQHINDQVIARFRQDLSDPVL